MNLRLFPLETEDLKQFTQDMQAAFQRGAVQEYPENKTEILPREDIEKSLSEPGAVAYKAVFDGEMVGGVILVIHPETGRHHLDFLYVKHGVQDKGVGQAIWQAVERLYPDTKVWETCTPYFEKRNIHFYVNRCGFHIVEFYNPHHKNPNVPEEMADGDDFFRFEKVMPFSNKTYEKHDFSSQEQSLPTKRKD